MTSALPKKLDSSCIRPERGTEALSIPPRRPPEMSRLTIARPGIQGRAGVEAEHLVQGCLRIASALFELPGCADGSEPAPVHDRQAAAFPLRLVHVVGGEEDREAELRPGPP